MAETVGYGRRSRLAIAGTLPVTFVSPLALLERLDVGHPNSHASLVEYFFDKGRSIDQIVQ